MIIKTGWLEKEGHSIKNWKKRFFVLTDDWVLYYFENDKNDGASPKGFVRVAGALVGPPRNPRKGRICLRISPSHGDKIILSCADEAQKADWEAVLLAASRCQAVGGQGSFSLRSSQVSSPRSSGALNDSPSSPTSPAVAATTTPPEGSSGASNSAADASRSEEAPKAPPPLMRGGSAANLRGSNAPCATNARQLVMQSLIGAEDVCYKCGEKVYAAEKYSVMKQSYHRACFKCEQCNASLSPTNFGEFDGKPYCKPHFQQLQCAETITAEVEETLQLFTYLDPDAMAVLQAQVDSGGGEQKQAVEKAGPEAIPGLISMLGVPNKNLQMKAVSALSHVFCEGLEISSEFVPQFMRAVRTFLGSEVHARQAQIATLICNMCSSSAAHRTMFSDPTIIESLCDYLDSTDTRVLMASCAAILNLTADPAIRKLVGEQKQVFSRLVTILGEEDYADAHAYAAGAVWSLAVKDNFHKVAFGEAGAIAPLALLLASDRPMLMLQAAGALSCLCIGVEDNKQALGELEVIPFLVAILDKENVHLQNAACELLCNLTAGVAANQQAAIQAKAKDRLKSLVKSGVESVKAKATACLSNLP